MESKSGTFTVVDYNEDTGRLIVDLDERSAQLLIEVGLSKLIGDYCEQIILEAKAESGSDETAEELKAMHQSTEQAAQDISYETKDLPL
jgi:hypothetical protein